MFGRLRLVGIAAGVMSIVATACGGSPSAVSPAPSTSAATPAVARTASPTAREKVTIRLTHHLPATHPNHKQMELFASEVMAKSNGDMEVQLFPAAQLYAEKDSIPAVQRGEVQMAMTTNSFWASLVPVNNILDLPFKFDSWDSFHRNVDGAVGQMLSKAMEEKGVKPLAWIDNSAIDLIGTNTKQVKSVADLKGLRLRSYSDAVSEMIAGWGAAPTIMSAGDVYSAVQRGTIDGLISGASFYERKWYEVTPYLTYVPVQFSDVELVANLNFWNKLAPDRQKILLDAAQAAQKLNRDQTPKSSASSYDQMRKLAKGWYDVPTVEIKQWQQSVSNMDAWYIKQAGDAGRQVLAAVK